MAEAKTYRAKVIRGVFARKAPGQPVQPQAEGTILELSAQEFAELKMSNFVVEAPLEVKKEEPKAEVKSKSKQV